MANQIIELAPGLVLWPLRLRRPGFRSRREVHFAFEPAAKILRRKCQSEAVWRFGP
jgi:hypothetical protein